jgi:hypothetical protein
MHKLMTLKPGEGICIRNPTHLDHTVDKNLRHLQKHVKEEETRICSATGLLNNHLAGGTHRARREEDAFLCITSNKNQKEKKH